jgi:hypothetical protein
MMNYYFARNNNISVWSNGETYYIYNWDTHNIISCSQDDFLFLNSITTLSRDDVDSLEKMAEVVNLQLFKLVE